LREADNNFTHANYRSDNNEIVLRTGHKVDRALVEKFLSKVDLPIYGRVRRERILSCLNPNFGMIPERFNYIFFQISLKEFYWNFINIKTQQSNYLPC
jgi:hypothetical protein